MPDDRDREREDDGRTVADMSGLERPSLFLPRQPSRRRETMEPRQESRPPWEETGLSKEERRWYVLGALRAALAIAMCFIVGLGVLIALLLLFWT